MTTKEAQIVPGHLSLGSSIASFASHAVNALVGNRQLLDEFSATAAHYDGLIDAIERAGWDLSKLERVKHAFDETAEEMIRELLDSAPDMQEHEERSFLAPFHNAIKQFARMTAKEKEAFRREYSRFADLHAQSLQELAARDIA
ncbi:MAG TPA: hypothetical protein VJM46_03215 [Candidatus Saccharimonadales bacterium]|nr:hypothetical protein [Candidatus Saccharimonadales bacterium]